MKSKPHAIVDFEINPELIAEGLTQSEMQCWDNCPEKWYLGYNQLLTKKGKFSWALAYGSWMHESLEQFYQTKGKRWSWNPEMSEGGRRNFMMCPLEVQQEEEYWKALGQIQMEVYASHYKGDFDFYDIKSTEEQIDFEFEGIRLKGMLDIYSYSKAHKGYYVWDHKTTGRLDKTVITGWDFRLQFMFYCWAASKVFPKMPIHGFIINAIKKPQLRQGQSETLPGFLQRVQSDMLSSPEKYFYRERLRLLRGDLQHFEEQILRPKLARTRMLLDPFIPPSVKSMLVRNKNTDHCLSYGQPCEFLNVCKHGLAIEKAAFIRREVKHQELAEETV